MSLLFYLQNEDGYYLSVKNGKYSITKLLSEATKLNNEKLKHVTKNMPKFYKDKKFKSHLYDNGDSIPAITNESNESTANSDINNSDIAAIMPEIEADTIAKPKITERKIDFYNPFRYAGDTSWEKENTNEKNFFQGILPKLAELRNHISNLEWELQECDLSIIDLLHFLRDEDTKLNARQLCSFSKILREYERRHRDLKLSLNKCKLIESNIAGTLTGEVLEKFENMDKPYNYRRLSMNKIKEMLA